MGSHSMTDFLYVKDMNQELCDGGGNRLKLPNVLYGHRVMLWASSSKIGAVSARYTPYPELPLGYGHIGIFS